MTRILLALMLGLSLVLGSAWAAQHRWLITPEEVAIASSKGPGQKAELVPMGAEQAGGPVIEVTDPKILGRLRTPVKLTVEFTPGPAGLEPDMKTLTVTLRGFINIDITDRVREYLRGSTLALDGAEIPRGTHLVRLAVADTGGNLTARDLTLVVVEGQD